jgi:uncharacterized phage-associated protein
MMNFNKLVQIVNYVLKKYDYRLNYTKLIKLLYIADRESLSRWGFAISGDKYCSMRQGPVLSGLYNFIKGNNRCESIEQVEWNTTFYKDGYDLVSHFEDSFSVDELSKAEISILDEVAERYADKSYSDLIGLVHSFPEWNKDAEKRNTSLILEKKAILKALGKSDEEVRNIIETEENLDQCEANLKAKGLLQ